MLLREKTNCSVSLTSAGSIKDQKPVPPETKIKGNVKRDMEQCGIMQGKETACFQKESTVSFITCYCEFKIKTICWVAKKLSL